MDGQTYPHPLDYPVYSTTPAGAARTGASLVFKRLIKDDMNGKMTIAVREAGSPSYWHYVVTRHFLGGGTSVKHTSDVRALGKSSAPLSRL